MTAYNQFASSLESRVLVTARKLQKLDQATVIGSVNIIDPDKSDVREITARKPPRIKPTLEHPKEYQHDSAPASEANTQPRGYAWPLPAVT